MVLSAGARLGPYEIDTLIGAGGMGVVYRARDTRLRRDVAIKVLPDELAAEPDRLARFEREAQVLASLSHPNIAQIYGVEESAAGRALVMELVEGRTLGARIAAGRVPLDDALAIATQIARALEAAHDAGVIHRDLKPANVMVRADGAVKVLDFGLAKAAVGGPAGELTASPTVLAHDTQAGIVLGTAFYLSPEQARGKPVDRRTDIWAFGVVLFEMLAGRRPFAGDGMSAIVADILRGEPRWEALPAATPSGVRRLLRRCLHKDPNGRLQHIGDARIELEEAARDPDPVDGDAVVAPPARRWRLARALAVGVTGLAAGAVLAWTLAGAPSGTELRVDIGAPLARDLSFALSPDGRMIAMAAETAGRPQLVVRSLDSGAVRVLAGTDAGQYPFWSPDGRSLGFFAGSQLKRVDLDGGPPQVLAPVLSHAGGTWSRDGTILYVPSDNGGVFGIPAAGGAARQVTPRHSPPLATRGPHALPDGRHFLFYVVQGGAADGVYVGNVHDETIRRLMAADGPALYGGNHLWFVREGALVAQPFDPRTHTLSGPIRPVADDVAVALFAAPLSVSAAGPVAFRTGLAGQRRQLVWFDRGGRVLEQVGEEGMLLSNPSLSPDDRLVAMARTVQQNIDLWMLDLERNVLSRLTVGPEIDSMPVWSPDGRRLVFTSAGQQIIRQLDGGAPDRQLRADGSELVIPCDWSADGRLILYKQFEADGGTDLWAIGADGASAPQRVASTPYNERDGQFSPDGKWMAFESNESGRPEVYVQPFPGPGAKTRISVDGGTQVRWRRDGSELFYLAADQRMMAVPVRTGSGPISVGTPVALFRTALAPVRSISRQQYAVSRDGQRFLIVSRDEAPAPPITLLLNWRPASTP